MGSDDYERTVPHYSSEEKNFWVEVVWPAIATFFGTGIIVVSLAGLGVIPWRPLGFHIALVAIVAGALVLLFITVLAVVLAVAMVKWFRWRYSHRYIVLGDDLNE